MSDEAHFELNEHVSKQNIPTYWSYFNPQQINLQPLHSFKVKNMVLIRIIRITNKLLVSIRIKDHK